MRKGAYSLREASWPYHYTVGNVMAQETVPFALASFAGSWLQHLGLERKKCLLVEDDESLPRPFSGSVKLYQDDGTCLALDTVAKPLSPENRYVRAVRRGDFDLIVVSVAGWLLRTGVEERCPNCDSGEHSALQHAVLHELVHVAFPEYSAHNEWTDNKVRELLEVGDHGLE